MYYLPGHPLTKQSENKFPTIFASLTVGGAVGGQGFNEK